MEFNIAKSNVDAQNTFTLLLRPDRWVDGTPLEPPDIIYYGGEPYRPEANRVNRRYHEAVLEERDDAWERIDQLQKKYDQLLNDYDELRREHNQLHNEVSFKYVKFLKAQIERQGDERRELERQNDQLLEKVNDYEDRLQRIRRMVSTGSQLRSAALASEQQIMSLTHLDDPPREEMGG